MHKTAKRPTIEPGTWQLSLIPKRPDPSNYSPVYTKIELNQALKTANQNGLIFPALWIILFLSEH